MEEILKYFENVSDPRSYRNRKHSFETIIGTTLLASLSGIYSFSGFADFTEAHIEELQKYFEFPNGVPSHDIYQRFWDAINPEKYLFFCFYKFFND